VNPVVIVGAGLSGLAAAVHLSSRRIPVLLLEQRKFPGGRAYSFVDDSTGTVIDNGQHVLIAGYKRTMEFLGMIGTRDRLAVQSPPEFVFHHPGRGFCSFRLPLLPSPLHLLGGIITTDLFSAADKLRLLRAGAALRSFRAGAAGTMTVDVWLDSLGQSAETKRSFWEPLAVAVMNERIGAASALVFIRALRTAFLSGARGAALAIPTVGLSDLYVEPARTFIERKGGVLRCGADVTRSVLDGENVAGVRLKEGETIGCSALILAVPSYRAASRPRFAKRVTWPQPRPFPFHLSFQSISGSKRMSCRRRLSGSSAGGCSGCSTGRRSVMRMGRRMKKVEEATFPLSSAPRMHLWRWETMI
jgi:predicted NAD/FAD-binding protein